MFQTSVPEAAVHKDSHPQTGEHKIRISGQGVMSTPPSDVMCPEQCDEPKFR